MGAVAAVLARSGDATPHLLKMLSTLRHRGRLFYAATPEDESLANSPRELSIGGSPLCVGYIADEAAAHRSLSDGIIFDGEVYPPLGGEWRRRLYVTKLNFRSIRETLTAVIRELDGAYTFAALSHDKLVVGRDPLGLKPLYYGVGGGLTAVAAERKALWAIGIRDAKAFPPGHLAILTDAGVEFEEVRRLPKPNRKIERYEDALRLLANALVEAVAERVSGLGEVAVAFSGGVDSGLLAYLASKAGVDVHLFTVGLGERREIRWAVEAAEMLNLPIHTSVYQPEDVEKSIPEVVWTIETPNPTAVSIAIPTYWTAVEARREGFRVVLSGQGADELFAGYHRYLGVYARFGPEGLEGELIKDLAEVHEVNCARDEKVYASQGVELRLPYMDWDAAAIALSISPQLKVRGAEDPLRKWILRGAADSLGLPREIAYRRKSAIQYATGVSNALRKLAKRKGMDVKAYLAQVFRELFGGVPC